MSSFGSSLINKGKKVVPKAAGRRRPGGAPSALAVQSDTASVSARSSLEPSATPQPELIGRDSVPPPGLPTPEVSQVSAGQTSAGDGIPTIQSDAPARVGAQQSQAARATSIHADDAIPTILVNSNAATTATTVGVARRDLSPVVQVSGPAKRRRIDNDEASARTASLPAPTRITRPTDDDEIPVIQVSKTPPRSLSKPSKAAAAAKRKRAERDGLVDYETPEPTEPEPSASSAPRRRAPRQAIAPLLMATINGPKPRAKGTRRNQWQITTPGELAASRARELGAFVGQGHSVVVDEVEADGVEQPKLRKVRKDKGVKKGPMYRNLEDEEDDEALAEDGTRARATSSGTRGRAIAPQPSPAVQPPDTEDSAPATGNSARLRNAQKRKAKQVAARSARSRANGVDTASAIDDAIAQSIEGSGSTRNPLVRVQSQGSRGRSRSNSMASDTTDVTVMTEGGTRQRKRYRRQATPPGNETVFIAEKVTPMLSLVGRDTENRVGQRSITEMRMRNVDWKEVKTEHAAKMREMAFKKGNRKTNDFDTIERNGKERVFEVQSARGTPASGSEAGTEDMEALDDIIKQRDAFYGPTKHQGITIINGEHRLDAEDTRLRTAGEEIESQMGDDEPAEEDDLKKRPFNVQTFIKWKRKDPAERVYQSARWTDEETEKFYEALRCCGVDFGSMAEWFPNRIRRSLKRKFNIEERANPERINETLDAHMMMLSNGDDGTAWDMAQLNANGKYELMNPRQVEEELRKIREVREVEIEDERRKYEEEKENQRLAGLTHSDDEEEEEEYEEVEVEVEEGEEDEEEEDIVTKAQREIMEKKRQKLEEATGVGAEKDDEENDDDEYDEQDEAEFEGEEAPAADWDDSDQEEA